MSTSKYKIPYYDFLGQDMSQRNGFLFVYHHNTSGVSTIFDEIGNEIITYGGDLEGNMAEIVANIILGKDDKIEKAEFKDGEIEKLDKWFWKR